MKRTHLTHNHRKVHHPALHHSAHHLGKHHGHHLAHHLQHGGGLVNIQRVIPVISLPGYKKHTTIQRIHHWKFHGPKKLGRLKGIRLRRI